jgi:hypothetical protein
MGNGEKILSPKAAEYCMSCERHNPYHGCYICILPKRNKETRKIYCNKYVKGTTPFIDRTGIVYEGEHNGV